MLVANVESIFPRYNHVRVEYEYLCTSCTTFCVLELGACYGFEIDVQEIY